MVGFPMLSKLYILLPHHKTDYCKLISLICEYESYVFIKQ